jgi:hypothetical protein
VQRTWLPIFLFLLGLLLGAGGVWEWHRRQWEPVAHSRALRQEMVAHLLNMAELYRRHITLVTAERALSTGLPGAGHIAAEIHRLWTHEFPVIKGHIERCELLLARLENRQPNAYDFRPPPLAPPPVPEARKKQTIKGPSAGGQKPTGGLRAPIPPPRSLHADPATTGGHLSREDPLDRTHLPTE